MYQSDQSGSPCMTEFPKILSHGWPLGADGMPQVSWKAQGQGTTQCFGSYCLFSRATPVFYPVVVWTDDAICLIRSSQCFLKHGNNLWKTHPVGLPLERSDCHHLLWFRCQVTPTKRRRQIRKQNQTIALVKGLATTTLPPPTCPFPSCRLVTGLSKSYQEMEPKAWFGWNRPDQVYFWTPVVDMTQVQNKPEQAYFLDHLTCKRPSRSSCFFLLWFGLSVSPFGRVYLFLWWLAVVTMFWFIAPVLWRMVNFNWNNGVCLRQWNHDKEAIHGL